MNQNIKLPSHEITHTLVTDLAQGIFDILGESTIRGIYLGGSLAIGGFNEKTSDIDFLVVTSNDIPSANVKALGIMHEKLRASGKNQLYRNYEGDYITAAQAQEPLFKDIRSPHLGTDGHFDVESHGAALIIDLWKIRKSGFIVYGEKPASVIGEISVEDVLEAKKTLFKSWWLPKLKRKDKLDSEYQAYAILTMARILYGVKQKDEVSKKDAAEWLMNEKPEYSALLQKALAWKEGITLNEEAKTYELIAFVDSQIQ